MTVNLAPEWVDSKETPGARFKVRALTGFEQLDVGNSISLTVDGTTISGATARAYLAGLLDWEGYVNPETNAPLICNAQNLRYLSSRDIGEIVTEIQRKTNLSADEAKN